jgi:hypothetical protein
VKKVKLTKKGEMVAEDLLAIGGNYENTTKLLIEIHKREMAKKRVRDERDGKSKT